ncbi:hypothetical protein V8G54_020617, partial [Vigna mungo]
MQLKHTILKQIIYTNISLILHLSFSKSNVNMSSCKKISVFGPRSENFQLYIDNVIRDEPLLVGLVVPQEFSFSRLAVEREFTCSIPQPVGMKARMQTTMSCTVICGRAI